MLAELNRIKKEVEQWNTAEPKPRSFIISFDYTTRVWTSYVEDINLIHKLLDLTGAYIIAEIDIISVSSSITAICSSVRLCLARIFFRMSWILGRSSN